MHTTGSAFRRNYTEGKSLVTDKSSTSRIFWHYTIKHHRQALLSKINPENTTRRKVNPPGSDTIPGKQQSEETIMFQLINSTQNQGMQQNFKEPTYFNKGKMRQVWHETYCSFGCGDGLSGMMFTAHSLQFFCSWQQSLPEQTQALATSVHSWLQKELHSPSSNLSQGRCLSHCLQHISPAVTSLPGKQGGWDGTVPVSLMQWHLVTQKDFSFCTFATNWKEI